MGMKAGPYPFHGHWRRDNRFSVLRVMFARSSGSQPGRPRSMSLRTHVENIFVSRSLAYKYALRPLLCNERQAERSARTNAFQIRSDTPGAGRSTNRMRRRGARS